MFTAESMLKAIITASLTLGAAVLMFCPSLGDVQLVYPNAYADIAPILQGIYDAEHDPLRHQLSWALQAQDLRPLRALVVPHHLTASMTIARGAKQLQGQSFKKILLLSPDHFFHCPTLLCTVNSEYQTYFGEAKADASIVEQLERSSLTTDQPELFKTEHGIFAVLPFLKYYAPNATVTPIVISQKYAWENHQQELLDLIASVIDDQTVLVLSSDFSHYLTLDQANAMDAQTQQAITTVDLNTIANLHNPNQSDCPNGLWLLTALAKQRAFANPTIIAHTNSATILNDPSASSTTSHFAITWR